MPHACAGTAEGGDSIFQREENTQPNLLASLVLNEGAGQEGVAPDGAGHGAEQQSPEEQKHLMGMGPPHAEGDRPTLGNVHYPFSVHCAK